MSSREMFLEINCPLDATFSHRDIPCRLDSMSASPSSQNSEGECYFKGYCRGFNSDANGKNARFPSIPHLYNAYNFRLKATLSEPTSSIVIRSEHQYNQKNQIRYALRKHLYEYADGEPEPVGANSCKEFGSLDCRAIAKSDRFRRYIGFVDLRVSGEPPSEEGIKNPIALGLLAPPSWAEANPNWKIATGHYGAFFGAPNFPATVFCTQDDSFGGAACAQMCLVMALVTLSDRRAKIEGSYALTFMAAEVFSRRSEGGIQKRLGSEADGHKTASGRGEEASFPISGLYVEQCERLLNERLGVSAFLSLFITAPREHDAPKYTIVKALLKAYITTRFPVILFLQTSSLTEGHAVSLIGLEQSEDAASCRLMYHDPAGIPFAVKPLKDLLHEAERYPRNYSTDHPFPSILFCADASVKRHPAKLVESLLGAQPYRSWYNDLLECEVLFASPPNLKMMRARYPFLARIPDNLNVGDKRYWVMWWRAKAISSLGGCRNFLWYFAEDAAESGEDLFPPVGESSPRLDPQQRWEEDA